MRVGRIAAIAAATVGLLASSASVASAHQARRAPQRPGAVTKATPWFQSLTGSAVNVSGNYAPIVGNFDADGHDDILWYASGSGAEQLWSGRGNVSTPFVKHPLAQQVNGIYVPIAGNFGGDSHTDILWYGPGSQADFLWISNGDGTFTSHGVSVAGVYNATVLHNAAPNHDSILWTIPDDGGTGSLWQFSSTGSHTSYSETIPGTPQRLVGDFDANGLDDLFLYNPGSGADALWRRSSTSNGTFTKTAETVNGNYQPVVEQFSPSETLHGPRDILWDNVGAGGGSLWEGTNSGTFTKSNHALPLGGTPLALHESWGYILTTGTAGSDMIWYDNGSSDYLSTSNDPKVNDLATPVVGDFVTEGIPSVLWYQPGSGAELMLIATD